jgi:hypothetical protein
VTEVHSDPSMVMSVAFISECACACEWVVTGTGSAAAGSGSGSAMDCESE